MVNDSQKKNMLGQDREARQTEVATTGYIPSGTQVHFRNLRNAPAVQLLFQLRKTQAEIKAGMCHAEWGAKQVNALNKLLTAKVESCLEQRERKRQSLRKTRRRVEQE